MTRSISRAVAAVAALAVAFVFGLVARTPLAGAASPPLQPQILNLIALGSDDLNPPAAGANLRAKQYVTADGATMQLQIGTVGKHYHADANESQYVVEGVGKEWLGDTLRDIKPGDLIIIPKGTNHAGTVETSGHLKILSIKTPPQDPADAHFVDK